MYIPDCSQKIVADIGFQYNVTSPGYPATETPGSICTWNIMGNNSTWFKITLGDVDLGNNGSCVNHLTLNGLKLCYMPDNNNNTIVLKNSSMVLGIFKMKNNGGRGVMLNVEGYIDSRRRLHLCLCLSLSLTVLTLLICWYGDTKQNS